MARHLNNHQSISPFGLSTYFENDQEYKKFKEECSKTGTTEESIAQAEKIGFKTNLVAINPFNPKQKVPVYFANFVLMDYGFGAVFGCPAHDQRDYDFAKKYDLEIKTCALAGLAEASLATTGTSLCGLSRRIVQLDGAGATGHSLDTGLVFRSG